MCTNSPHTLIDNQHESCGLYILLIKGDQHFLAWWCGMHGSRSVDPTTISGKSQSFAKTKKQSKTLLSCRWWVFLMILSSSPLLRLLSRFRLTHFLVLLPVNCKNYYASCTHLQVFIGTTLMHIWSFQRCFCYAFRSRSKRCKMKDGSGWELGGIWGVDRFISQVNLGFIFHFSTPNRDNII